VLRAWLEAGHSVAGVWTSSRISRAAWRQDRHLGWFAPKLSLAATIAKWRLPLRRVDSMASATIADALAAAQVDVIVSVFFPLILPRTLLARLRPPIFNLHPSLLPAYRGPAPIIAMLFDETADKYGGVTLHRLVARIDAGAICAAAPVPLPPDRNPRRWEIHLARAAARLIVDALPKDVAGTLAARPQDEASATPARPTGDVVVTTAVTGGRLDWLVATLGWFGPVSIAIGELRHDVSRVRRLGPASGAPPRIGLTTIDVDLADGRHRLSRRPIWQGRKLRWATFLLRVRERE
jgi:methionyl-tRNA formyltransferase